MKYLIMECHMSHAVALSSDGRFLKVANMDYETGQTVDYVVELSKKPKIPAVYKYIGGFAALAACLCLFFFGFYSPNYLPYGTVYLTINPELEMTLSKNGRVLFLEPLNGDGAALIHDYEYKGKDRDEVIRELIELSIEDEYLSDGGKVALSVSSKNLEWSEKLCSEIMDNSDDISGRDYTSKIEESSDNTVIFTVSKSNSEQQPPSTSAPTENTSEETSAAQESTTAPTSAPTENTSAAQESTSAPTYAPTENTSAQSSFISDSRAKEIAFAHSGIDPSSAVIEKVELEEDDGIWEYEVEFKSGSVEYKYKINAANGNIIDFEKETDDD